MKSLYQPEILQHSQNAQNIRQMPYATHQAEGYNRLCGDHIQVYLHMRLGEVEEVSFDTTGCCALCKASASMMSEFLQGQSFKNDEALIDSFVAFIKGKDEGLDLSSDIQSLVCVRDFPARVGCVFLPWETFRAALRGQKETVTTEK